MQNISDVIDALGGVTAVSKALGQPIGTVSAWKSRNSIPSDRIAAVVAVARSVDRHDITSDLLADLLASGPLPSLGEGEPLLHNAEVGR